MLDQSFSADNFLRIFQVENRKGTFNRDLLSREYLLAHEKVKYLFATKGLSRTDFDRQLAELNELKLTILKKDLQLISDKCNAPSFKFVVSKFNLNGKDIFTIDSDPASFFAMKQLQFNIFRTFKVKQANRFEVVKQLRTLLEDNFPKVLVRIDVKGFYENIPQSLLYRKINENQLLNYQSKKLLKSLLFSYEKLKDANNTTAGHGIPRGIGISAYLSELYMREVDNLLRDIPDLVYYSRYVDDAAFVFVPKSRDNIPQYLDSIRTVVSSHGLLLKDGSDGGLNKTLQLDLMTFSTAVKFDLLGYKFVIENSKLKELKLSDNKIQKYDNRLRASIEAYNATSKFAEKDARKLLINRLRFLTGNFHLLNNKKRIKSGIYYSNIQIADNNKESGDFKHLNNLLKRHLSNLKPYPKLGIDVNRLRNRLVKRYDFSAGFYKKEKHFYSFTDIELNEIVSVWK